MPKSGFSKLMSSPGARVARILVALVIVWVVALPVFKTFGAEGVGYMGLFVVVPATYMSLRWWRSLDEPSKEAHKFAFLWGWGGGAGIVALIGILLAYFAGPRDLVQGWVEGWIALSKGYLGAQQGAVGAYLTIIAATILQTLAYMLVWLGWWARQRVGTTSD